MMVPLSNGIHFWRVITTDEAFDFSLHYPVHTLSHGIHYNSNKCKKLITFWTHKTKETPYLALDFNHEVLSENWPLKKKGQFFPKHSLNCDKYTTYLLPDTFFKSFSHGNSPAIQCKMKWNDIIQNVWWDLAAFLSVLKGNQSTREYCMLIN